MSDLNLSINIGAIDAASAVFRSVGSAFKSLASGDIAGAATTAATAVVAVGAASVKMAADFQSGITSLSTGAGESTSNLKMVGDGILDLAIKTGTSTKQLTDGMYMIESAGFHGADGLKVLQSAAEGAKVGMRDLKDVANGVTTALTDYQLPASQAAAVTNDLVATVANGKTTMGSLASSLKSILPIASSAGISLNGVSAAMATMTGEGVPAGQAANYLKTTVLALEAPSTKGAAALKSIGLSAADVANEMKDSLPGALQMITDHLKTKFPEGSQAYTAALKNITGGSSALSTVLDLTGSHMQTFNNNVDNIYNAVRKGGDSITGWSQVQGDFNTKMDQAQQAVNVLMIKLGQNLLPVVGQVVGAVAPAITSFIAWESKTHTLENAMHTIGSAIGGLGSTISTVITFFKQHQDAMNVLKAALIVIAIQILSIVVPAFITFAATAISAAVTTLIAWFPFIAAFALVTAVVFGIIEAVQHWGQIVAWLKGVWGAVSSWFTGMLHTLANFFVGVWNGIVAGVKAAWNFIVQAVKTGVTILLAVLFAPIILIAGLFIWLYQHNTYFKQLVDAIVNFFKACIAWIMSAWQAVSAWLVGAWNDVVKFATALWQKISTTINAYFSMAIAYVQAVWNKISSFFVNAWSTYISGPLTTLWNNVSSVFMNAWNTYIAGPLGGIWNSISTWFTNLGTSAMNSGKNFINMLVSGIQSGAGAIWNAVVGIAQNIWKALGFHSPAKEGPGADADKWMPNLVSMLSSDLMKGVPKIQAAVNAVAKPLATLGSPQAATAATAGPGASQSSGGDNNIAIHVHLNGSGTGSDAQKQGKDIADVVKKELARHLRQQAVTPRYTSGGSHH